MKSEESSSFLIPLRLTETDFLMVNQQEQKQDLDKSSPLHSLYCPGTRSMQGQRTDSGKVQSSTITCPAVV